MALLIDAPPLAASAARDAPPITVTRSGMRWPQDYDGRMDTAWSAVVGGEWCDAMALAASAADVEVDTVRHLLNQARKKGILCVRHRARGVPRRLRTDYRVRPKMADSYEAQTADLARRFLYAHGRRDAFHPRKDADNFAEWLRNVGQHKVWRRCRDGSGMDVDSDLFAVIHCKHPRLIATTPRGLGEGGLFRRHLPRGILAPARRSPCWSATRPNPRRLS